MVILRKQSIFQEQDTLNWIRHTFGELDISSANDLKNGILLCQCLCKVLYDNSRSCELKIRVIKCSPEDSIDSLNNLAFALVMIKECSQTNQFPPWALTIRADELHQVIYTLCNQSKSPEKILFLFQALSKINSEHQVPQKLVKKPPKPPNSVRHEPPSEEVQQPIPTEQNNDSASQSSYRVVKPSSPYQRISESFASSNIYSGAKPNEPSFASESKKDWKHEIAENPYDSERQVKKVFMNLNAPKQTNLLSSSQDSDKQAAFIYNSQQRPKQLQNQLKNNSSLINREIRFSEDQPARFTPLQQPMKQKEIEMDFSKRSIVKNNSSSKDSERLKQLESEVIVLERKIQEEKNDIKKLSTGNLKLKESVDVSSASFKNSKFQQENSFECPITPDEKQSIIAWLQEIQLIKSNAKSFELIIYLFRFRLESPEDMSEWSHLF